MNKRRAARSLTRRLGEPIKTLQRGRMYYSWPAATVDQTRAVLGEGRSVLDYKNRAYRRWELDRCLVYQNLDGGIVLY